MKLLQVIDSFAMGGAEVLISNMHSGLRERGIDCEYYVLRAGETPLAASLLDQNARIHAPLSASVYSPLHIFAFEQHLRSHSYDLVHVHLFPAQLWAACGARLARLKAPLVTTEHSTEVRRRKRWYRFIDRWMYAQYRLIASVSAAVAANLAAWLPEVRGRIADCPNGIDVEAFSSATSPGKRALLSVPEETLVVLTVGSLEYAKGHETLLRAMCFIPDGVLVLVGEGPLSGKLRELASELGIASRVKFLGRRRDVAQLLKVSDVYVQPSRWESFGLAALEAMASGRAVIASDVPGLAQIVGDAGLLFTADDAAGLAERIALLLGNPALRGRLGASALKRARHFGLDATLDRYAAIYHHALKQDADEAL
jgi:glycosyltransferase involved in cell wall biosynthesis